MVRKGGLEPPPLAGPDPKAGPAKSKSLMRKALPKCLIVAKGLTTAVLFPNLSQVHDFGTLDKAGGRPDVNVADLSAPHFDATHLYPPLRMARTRVGEKKICFVVTASSQSSRCCAGASGRQWS